VHANARRRRFGARALGPGGHLGLQRLVVVFEKSRVGSKLEKLFSFSSFSGRLARARAGVYRTLSGCPGRLGPGGRASLDRD